LLCTCVQNSAEVLSIISLLYDAKKKIDKWPSRAPDKGTVERNTIHLLTTMLNKLNTSCEYSGPQSVAHFLDLPANYTMHRRIFLFSDQAIQFVKDSLHRLNNPELETLDDNSDTSSFSSGVYSEKHNSNSESSSESDTLESISQPKLSKLNPTLSPLSEDEEFGVSIFDPNANYVSDTDSDAPAEIHQRIDGLLTRSSTQHGSVPVVRNKNGQLIVVTQAEDYMHRSAELIEYSLYELINTTYRKDIKQLKEQEANTQNLSDSDSDSDEPDSLPNENEIPKAKSRIGRPSNTICNFQKEHPLAESHALVLRPIYTISQFIKKVPPFPGARPSILTEAWKDRARNFAEFCLVVFRPWKGPHGLPESITWRGFCEYMHEIQNSASIVDRTRAAFIINCAHNFKISASVSKILKIFRGSAATRWTEMPRHLRPRRWLFGDENNMEKNLPSKNTTQEAELAMAELIHKICKASPSETKKQDLIDATILKYKKSIGAHIHDPSFKAWCVQTIFNNELPPLHERLDCFTPAMVDDVHDHNMIKQSDRNIQHQLNTMHSRPETKKKKTNPLSKSGSNTQSKTQTSIVWSPQQAAILAAITNFVHKFVQWKNKRSPPPDPLYVFIFGGPGIIPCLIAFHINCFHFPILYLP
jgi:hypothetical protein